MDLKDIESFIALAKKEGVSSLKYESNDIKISVTLPSAQAPSSYLNPPYKQQENTFFEDKASAKVQASQIDKDAGFHKVTSPFVGTFYSCPAPGENSYVHPGEKVKKGQVLCIVEAMKIMNEIDSDVVGEVVKICVENESLVEYGQVLFLIKVQ